MTSSLPAAALRWRDIAELTSVDGYPCVSVLLATTPAGRMIPADVLELAGLVERAERTLKAMGEGVADALVARLRRLAGAATKRPQGRALGLFVSAAVERCIVLPVPVTSRVLVEPSFATRDLLRALHRTPPHLLLTLYPGAAGFFHAQGPYLTPVDHVMLSVTVSTFHTNDGLPATAAATASMLDEVDTVLGKHRASYPAPLVIAGSSALVEAFCRRSRHLDRLAGRITTADTPEQLQQLAGHALEGYLRSRELEALELVEQAARERPRTLATRLDACWVAAHQAPPVVLAVEEGYTAPGHHFAAFHAGTEAAEPLWQHDLHDDPYYVHDLVDDLLEAVITRGGWVAFVADGALTQHGRVALVSME